MKFTKGRGIASERLWKLMGMALRPGALATRVADDGTFLYDHTQVWSTGDVADGYTTETLQTVPSSYT